MNYSALARRRWRIPSTLLLAFVGVAAAISSAVGLASAMPAPHVAVQSHVIFTPSPSPAYANDAGTRDPSTRWHVLRVHDRHPAGELHPGAHLGESRVGVGALHGRFGLERIAEPSLLGDGQHTDLARRLLLRRALGHVLRRLTQRPSGGLRLQLHLGGDGVDAQPARLHRHLARPAHLRQHRAWGCSTRVPSSIPPPERPICSGRPTMVVGPRHRLRSGRLS